MKTYSIYSILFIVIGLIGNPVCGFSSNKKLAVKKEPIKNITSDVQPISGNLIYVYMQPLVNKGDRYPYDGKAITAPEVRFYLYEDNSGYSKTIAPAGFTLYVEYSYKKGNGTATGSNVINMSGKSSISFPLSYFTASDDNQISNWNITLVAKPNYEQINWGNIGR
ncbi:hypothetical protein AACH28_08080 [Sphingobacterium thalpophilum]|uniref:Uncharacterized protein n=1 Tax=Sphingobacterium thalpophilum TaxID=259 RepID=A0ACD5C743_9SPHI|nr:MULTISPECIES: hypothetical protein [Sphingobacterium]